MSGPEGGVMASSRTQISRAPTFRDSFCNLQPSQLRIPRPTFTGMQFVQTRGRQGYYLTTRRGDPWGGVNAQSRRPLLSDIRFEREAIPEDNTSSKSSSSLVSSDNYSTTKSTSSSGSECLSDGERSAEGKKRSHREEPPTGRPLERDTGSKDVRF